MLSEVLALGSVVGGKAIDKALGLGGGGGGGDAMPMPVNFTGEVGDTRFGDKIIGTDALKNAPALQTPAWLKAVTVGALVLVAVAALFAFTRRPRTKG